MVRPSPRSVGVFLAAFGAAAGLWWLYTTGGGFPAGFHADEPKKLRFALSGEQDFHHPILMIQAMRLARELLGIVSPDDMLAVGRQLSAAYTLLAVGLAVLVFRRLLRPAWAAAAALTLAVTPLLSTHAHYVKEDAVFLATIMLSLWALLRFIEAPERRARVVVFGLAMGLALAAQYKAVLFLGLVWALPSLGAAPSDGGYFLGLRRASTIAAGVFLLVCYPLLLSASTFGGGVTEQVGHVLSGHYVKIYAIPQVFTYHLRKSLIPGLTPPLVALALAGTVWAVASWRRLDVPWRVALLYLAVFYLSAELSPSKPHPDFMRYMMPAAPIAVVMGFRLLQQASSIGGKWVGLAAAVVFGIALTQSVELVRGLEVDTRYTAEADIRELEAEGGIRVLVETYASTGGSGLDHHELEEPADMRAQGFTHLVLSSFAADRYLEAERLGYQRAEVYAAGERMRRLLALPKREIRSERRSVAFSNPTIWIIDLREAAEGR